MDFLLFPPIHTHLKLGKKTQPWKSTIPEVCFNFMSKTEYYKNITEDPTKTLPYGFTKVSSGPTGSPKKLET